MIRKFGNIIGFCGVFLTIVSSFSISSFAQLGGDLGGSSGVFRPKNPTVKKTPATTSRPTTTKATVVALKKPAVTAAKSATNTTVKMSVKSTKSTVSSKPAKSRKSLAEQFDDAIESGNAARDERNFVKAEVAYKQAFKINPRDSRGVYGLGNIYIDQQLWNEAEKSYREAIKLNAEDANAFVALSYVLVQPNRGGSIAERLSEAERMARRAVAIDKSSPVAFDQLGVALETRGVIDTEAENAYRRAIEIDPNYAIAYAHLGRLLRKNGRKAEADAEYKNAVEKAADVPTFILVAEVLQSEQRFNESEKLLRKAVAMDATNPTALLLLGRALSIQKNFEEAEKVLLESIRISPRSFQAYTVLGSIYLRSGRFDDAETTYLKAAKVGTETERKQLAGSYGLSGVGDAYMQLGRTSDALRAYLKAAEFDAANTQLKTKIAQAGGK